MNKSDFNNAFKAETFGLPKLAKQLSEENDRDFRMALTVPQHFSPRKVVLTGCGDSYCAAMAAAPVFEELGHIDATAMPAIEFTRHFATGKIGGEPCNPMTFIISASGSPSRVIEAAKRAKECGVGALSVAVTANGESELAKNCVETLFVKTPEFENKYPYEHSPGTRSYYANMYALLTQAIRMGELKMHYPMSQAGKYKQACVDYAASYEPVMEQIDDQMFELAKTWKDLEKFEFVACGPEATTAWFGAAKVYEASGDIATSENTEDWCHINYFAKDPENIGTVVIIGKDSTAYNRTVEVTRVMARIGRPTLVITDGDKADFPAEVTVCTVPSPEYSFAFQLMNYVPINLLSGYIAKMKDAKFFRGGEGVFGIDDGSIIKQSEITVIK